MLPLSILGSLLAGSFAWADNASGERLIASMDKTSSSGIFNRFENVRFTLTSVPHATTPSGLVLEFGMDDRGENVRQVALRVVAKRFDSCGNVRYLAESYPGYLSNHNMKVELKDYSRSRCPTTSAQPWEAVVTYDQGLSSSRSRMTLTGEPEIVVQGR